MLTLHRAQLSITGVTYLKISVMAYGLCISAPIVNWLGAVGLE